MGVAPFLFAKLRSGIILPDMPHWRRHRINEKVFIYTLCPSRVYRIGISRAVDCHKSLLKLFRGPFDDYSS
jgi:hypothetical protein